VYLPDGLLALWRILLSDRPPLLRQSNGIRILLPSRHDLLLRAPWWRWLLRPGHHLLHQLARRLVLPVWMDLLPEFGELYLPPAGQ
jgi:hypothetical protein